MKKSVTLKINGDEKKVIGYDESTIVTCQISYNPHYKKANGKKYSYHCDGFGKEDKSYAYKFCGGEIEEKQIIQIQFDSEEEPNVLPEKREIKFEKRCSFCNKLDSEVEVIIEKNLLHRICNECVDECRKTIEERNV